MFVIVEAKRMGQKTVFCGYSAAVEKLYDDAASIGDFHILKSGAASARSGKYTGKVPQYKRIVDNLPDGVIDWGDVNKRITSTEFQILLAKAKEELLHRKPHNHSRGVQGGTQVNRNHLVR